MRLKILFNPFTQNQVFSIESYQTYVVTTSLLCLSGQEMAPTRQRPLLKDTLGARMNIMWEEQLVDPPTDYITSVNAM